MPQLQQLLLGLSPENQQKFYDERDQFFDETDFPHALPENFDHYRFFIGCHINELQIGITAKNFNDLFYSKSIERYSVGNIAAICEGNSHVSFFMYVQSFGKKDNGTTTAEWCYMREAFEIMADQVNKIVEPKMIALINKLTVLQNSIVKGGNHDTANYKKKTLQLPQ